MFSAEGEESDTYTSSTRRPVDSRAPSDCDDCDDAWVGVREDAEPAAIEPVAVEPVAVEPVAEPAAKPAPVAGHRYRKRDGKLVRRSPLWYGLYKRSRRALKRAKLYVGSAEDRPKLVKEWLMDWCQVRWFHCRFFLQQLADYERISAEQAAGCMDDVCDVLHFVLANPHAVEGYEMGSAWQWSAMLAQQRVCEELGGAPLVFDHMDAARLWSLASLHEAMTRAPHKRGPFCGPDQQVEVQAEAFDARTPEEHWRAAKFFDRLMDYASPSLSGTRLHEPIAEAKAPKYKSKSAFGTEMLVEV